MYYEDFMAKYSELPIACYTSKRDKLESCTVPWISRHLHKEFEILYIEAGYANISLNKKQFKIQAGDVVLIPPFVSHEGTASNDFSFAERCICFDVSLLQSSDATLAEALLDENSRCCILSSTDGVTSAVIMHLLEIIEACQCHNIGWNLTVKGHLMLLFALLISKFEHRVPQHSHVGCDFYRDVIRFVADNYPADITSKTVSDTLCYSQSYFCRRFKSNFGLCFNEYLNEYRLTAARNLLLEKKYTVTETATMVGFSNSSYFTQRFQQQFGMLPSEYSK